MVWPILISVGVTPGALSAAAVGAAASTSSATTAVHRRVLNFPLRSVPASAKAAHEFGLLAAAGHDQAEIVARENHAHAEADVFGEQLLGIDPAHARRLVVPAARGDDALIGAGDLGVIELAGNAHLHGEIVGADEQHVDAGNG